MKCAVIVTTVYLSVLFIGGVLQGYYVSDDRATCDAAVASARENVKDELTAYVTNCVPVIIPDKS